MSKIPIVKTLLLATLLSGSLITTSTTLAQEPSEATDTQDVADKPEAPDTPAAAGQPKSFKIERITPQGEDASMERQIVFTFNQPVVPLGKMERQAADIPITITPMVECQWRWLDTSNLACQLGEKSALKLATRYDIVVKPGIMTEAHATLLEPVKHHFITERPAVSYTMFNFWQGPAVPVIRVNFNQPVTKASVVQHLYMQTEESERVALKVEVIPVKKTKTEESEAEDEEDDNAATSKSNLPPADVAKAWLVSPAKTLPLDTAIKLMVEPGLQSTIGPEAGVETRAVDEFATFPEFNFVGVKCNTLKGDEITIDPEEKWSDRCDPVTGAFLVFSSPVTTAVVKTNLSITPDLAGGRKDYDPWEGETNRSHLQSSHSKTDTYQIWLPEILKAYEVYHLKSDNLQAFKDEFGRPLAEAIDLAFATDHRAPKHVFEHPFAVLEKGVDSEVPLYVTNLDKLTLAYNFLTANGWSKTERKTVKLPNIRDVAFKMPLGIRELMPMPNQTGVVQGYFVTNPDINNEEAKTSNWFFSEVTPFHVQVKLGYHNTLVWVTDFATGLPVKGADISIYKDDYKVKTALPKTIVSAQTDDNGVAMLPGTEKLDPQLKVSGSSGNKGETRFFVRCQKDEDFALLPLDYNFAVQMYEMISEDFSLYPQQRPQYGHIHTWGATAQGIYKVGDTVQYKFLVRDQSNEAFVPAPQDGYTLQVTDPKGEVVHEVKNLTLSDFGAYAGEFTIPKTAAVGWYDFKLTAKFTQDSWQPLRVLVSDFTPAPFHVQTVLNGELFKIGEKVQVNTATTLHAGGPYVNAQTKVNAILRQDELTPSQPQLKGFQFDVFVEKPGDETIYSLESAVDNKGQLLTAFTLSEKSKVLYGKLTVESAVRDDRGKDVANRATARYVGRDRFVGLKETGWFLTAGQAAKVLMAVVDEFGNPVTGTPIKGKIERKDTKAARVKGAGNAYLAQYNEEWLPEGTCEAKSGAEPSVCTFTPSKAGDYRVTATIEDTHKRPHSTELAQWATGKNEVVWEMAPGNGLDMKAEQDSYKVGETARYLVRNPFPGANALVTVERFGTIKSWVKKLETSTEIIEVPVEPDYVPGFFVSVMVMSPRVDKPLDQNQVDLGKPAFRMGYAKTMVKDPYKELLVDIHSDKPEYKPGEQVTVNLQAKGRQNCAGGPCTPIELAVTVLDEAVFDLISQGRSYFDPYQGFYTLDDLDIANFSLLMRLVGRQKFEKKGANAGGDGGIGLDMRSVFKYVSYWNPAIKTDADGKAQIQFKVPDNLTGWRVLAMAVTPTDRMGLGEGNFKVNQPIEIRPVLPNQITVGDTFQAGFNIMNRTNKAQELTVTLKVKGPADILENAKTTQTFKAEPFKRYNVWLPLKTKEAGTLELSAVAKAGELQDGLRKTLTVQKRRSLETAATYGTTIEKEVTESIEFPKDIHPDAGGLTVITSPTVIGNVEGAFEYMRDYPYACWEQKLSKGVMASHYHNLQAYLPEKFIWEDSKTLPEETLKQAADFQAPNGGMVWWIAKDDYVSPYLSAYTALAFNWLRDSGHPIPNAVENKLHEYLLTLLRRDVMPNHYSKGMSSSVRAVALAALAKHEKIARADLNRYQTHLKNMDLFGKSMFLAAALQVPNTDKLRTEVVKLILAKVADQTAGKISFKEDLDDGYQHLLSSSLRTQCTILSSLVKYAEATSDEQVSDIPFKLVRNIIQARKTGGYWANTQENMFCMNALTDFVRVYERDKPAMTVRTWLAEEKFGETQFNDVKNPPVTASHPMTANDPGRKAKVKLERDGQGRIYYTVRLSYASKEEKATAINAGMEINREYHVERDGKWVLLKSPMELKTGELVRVDLYLSLPAARYFVVVDDPVPGGLEPVNRDLATTSEVAADKAKGQYMGGSFWFSHDDWKDYGIDFWSFYHKELRHEAARFFADYLPAGNYHLSYVAQAIAPGEFSVMPTHTEEMYEPEVYGKSVPATLKVIRDPKADSK
jgi:hypothetical protein